MEKDALRRSIIGLLEGELAATGFDLLDVRLFAGGGRLHVRVFLDRAGGVGLQDCTAASRTIDALLEESRLLGEAYVIEASSPGVRRPLRTPVHFAAVVGQRIEVRVGSPRPSTRRGVLLAVGEAGLRLRTVEAAPAPAESEAELDAETGAEIAPIALADAGPDADAGPAGEEFAVAWDDLAAANLDPDFDIQALINADRRERRDRERAERRQAKEARDARLARRRRPRTE